MKKCFLSTLIAVICFCASAQDAGTQVLQQAIQNATSQQIEALKKASGDKAEALDATKNNKPVNLPAERNSTDSQVEGETQEALQTENTDNDELDPLVVGIAGRAVAARPVFGREIFRSKNLTFAPSMSMATPPSYVLASNDELNIVFWGAAEGTYVLKISPEGNINIPNVGLVNLSGLTVAAAERRIREKLASAITGLTDGSVHVKVTLGNIRSIKVNIVGEVQNPGTYTLPSLATLFNALYVAGGVNNIGSLRSVKLYRAGKEIAVLDVYDYLLKGKTDIDMRLEDNDMIVISPYDNIVTIVGKVKRPRSYEMKRGEDLATLIAYAGDFAGDAYHANISLIRRSGGQQYALYTVDKKDFDGYQIFDRDVISVGEIVPAFSNRVEISGAVWRPGAYELSDSLKTVSQLIKKAEGLTPDAFAGRAQIVRMRPDLTLEIIPVNLGRIMAGQAKDIAVLNADRLIITSISELNEDRFVTIKGEVNNPSSMPYMDNMTLEDIIIMAKGLRESASLARVEVARRVKNPSATQTTSEQAELFTFTIPEDLSLTDDIAGFTLQPFDEVYIRRSPGYSAQRNIFIEGQVAFPGEYTLATSATKLTDLIRLTGGFTNDAYVNGASLYRRLTADDVRRIASVGKVKNATSNQDMLIRTQNLGIGDYYQVGINLSQALSDPNGKANIVVEEGDRLVVPLYNGMVKIEGAVYFPTSTTYQKGMTAKHYIEAAGGYSDKAKRRPFVIYQNGTISTKGGLSGLRIEPGCEIVVPEKPYREPMSPQAWIGISSSVVSMCAMLISILR